MIDIILYSIGGFIISFVTSLLFGKFCVIGDGKEIQNKDEQIFWILILICLPLLLLVVGTLSGFWEWIDGN